MKCDRCDNQSVYTRKYSGQSLCAECFSNSILRKTARTISKYNMIKNNELVAVAVSKRLACLAEHTEPDVKKAQLSDKGSYH